MCRIHTALLFVLTLAAASVQARPVDLAEFPETTPYASTEVPDCQANPMESRFTGDPVLTLDITGDGFEEFLYSRGSYLAARGYDPGANIIYYQKNLPPEFASPEAFNGGAALALGPDLNADGRPDVLAWMHTPDRALWRFWIMDPYTGDVHGEFDLPGGTDVDGDGKWDGSYYYAGAIEQDVGGDSTTILILGCTVGHDRYGRGILAIDPRDGSLVWRYETGPNPFRFNTQVVDLDGDGRREIVFCGRSPQNLHGEKINGFSDDESRLFMLDGTGRLLWSRHLSGWFGNVEMSVANLGGDDNLEIATASRVTPDLAGELAVWSHTGQKLASYQSPHQLLGADLVQRNNRPYPSLLTTTSELRLLEFAFTGQELTLRQSAVLPARVRVNLVADLLPGKGTEVVLTCREGETYVLDRKLKPRAAFSVDRNVWYSQMQSWRPDAETLLLTRSTADTPTVSLARAPFAWPSATRLSLAGSVALACIAAAVLLSRRPRHAAPHLLRETRLHLLEDLQLANHGAIAPLKCIRRLTWHLRALQTDLSDHGPVEERMRETWSECRHTTLPHLQGILDRARLAGIADDRVAAVAAAVAELDQKLADLAENNFEVARDAKLVAELEGVERQAEAALSRVRQEVAGHFRADIPEVLARVRNAQALALENAGVVLRAGMVQAAVGASVIAGEKAGCALCDPKELEYVLDNLIGNALVAMAKAPVRELRTTWHVQDGMVQIDVSDTGCGLPEAEWSRALNTRYSTKPEGGAGLPTSRRHLRKYGGDLQILRSAPGTGTTIRVTLPAC